MSPRILLLGKNGQVGWELQRSLSAIGQLVALDKSSCDLAHIDQIQTAITSAQPDVIVNAAAYTAVDKAEQDSATAFRINAEAVAAMAAVAAKRNALLIHYSTDYVFDGSKPVAYVEEDVRNPLSVYGKSKAAGELAISNSGCRHLTFRTSWVFAARGLNFAKTMMRLASERDSLRVVADQWGAPTSAELIADVTAHALREVLANQVEGGLYHLAASGETSWQGYANFVLQEAVRLGAKLKAHSAEPISTLDYPLPATRPANSRLDTTKLQNAFNLELPDWRYHTQRMLTELLGNS
ncbi:MAG: rfbD [Verrucomicrobiaceae bacterium]|nr:rfbD [Verrucomicrobiaceae bacterium]